jgi:sugar phosphate isomerase/epimerase
MNLGPDHLVLCSGTLPPATSFVDRLGAARAGGFDAISLWGRDYERARAEGHSDADMRAMLDDHGLCVAELDPAWWWLPGAGEVRIPPEADPVGIFRFGESEIFAIADAIGARSLNAVDVVSGSWEIDAAAEAFAGLCSRAQEHGLLVHIEWLAWSKIPDLETATEIVRLAQSPNGGINVDTWHLTRTHTDLSELQKVPGETVLAVQLDDGPPDAEEDLVHATLHARELPGEGEFDLAGIVAVLRETGSLAPIGVEVFSDDLHALGAHEAAIRAASAARSVLEEVR